LQKKVQKKNHELEAALKQLEETQEALITAKEEAEMANQAKSVGVKNMVQLQITAKTTTATATHP
jgi:hypothetical protein